MKKLLLLSVLFWSMTSFIQQEKPKKIIFFGDSITQAGVQPNGYITKLQEMIDKKETKPIMN